MTDTQDLIAQLRKDAHHHIDGQMAGLMDEAADALEAAQAEIERLKETCYQHYHTSCQRRDERDAALARLAEIEAKERTLDKLLLVFQDVQELVDKNEALQAELDKVVAGEKPVGVGSYVQHVPERCDRIIWRGNYYGLPIAAGASPAQPSQAGGDLRGIDAGPLSEWVDLVKRGYVSKDECLIAVKDVPKWVAKNQPSQAGEPVLVSQHLGRLVASGMPESIDQFQLTLNAAFAAGMAVAARQKPAQPSQAGLSNPNNCQYCDHSKNPQGGHCYMFREAPTEKCHKHTLAGVSAAINAKESAS